MVVLDPQIIFFVAHHILIETIKDLLLNHTELKVTKVFIRVKNRVHNLKDNTGPKFFF